LLRPQLFPLFYCINTVDHYEKMSHFGIHSSVQSKYLRSGSIFFFFYFFIFFLFYNSTFFISSTFHNLVWFFWPPNGDDQDSSDKRIFLGLSFPGLPTLLIGASQKTLPNFALWENRVFADLINKALQLVHPVLDELVLVATLVSIWFSKGLG
jgi:hypothetical protein